MSVKTGHVTISLSAKSAGMGLELLREHLKACMGYEQTSESSFSARRRHSRGPASRQ